MVHKTYIRSFKDCSKTVGGDRFEVRFQGAQSQKSCTQCNLTSDNFGQEQYFSMGPKASDRYLSHLSGTTKK